MYELNVSSNKIPSIPPWIALGKNIQVSSILFSYSRYHGIFLNKHTVCLMEYR